MQVNAPKVANMQVQEVQEWSLGPEPCLGCSLQAQGDSGDTHCDTLAAVHGRVPAT